MILQPQIKKLWIKLSGGVQGSSRSPSVTKEFKLGFCIYKNNLEPQPNIEMEAGIRLYPLNVGKEGWFRILWWRTKFRAI